jgi:hypothetical protein
MVETSRCGTTSEDDAGDTFGRLLDGGVLCVGEAMT